MSDEPSDEEIARVFQEIAEMRAARQELNARIKVLVDRTKLWKSWAARESAARQQAASERRIRDLCEMRAAGATYKEIAEHFSVSAGRARQIYEMQRWRTERTNV